jgi:hypothetical protein
LLNCELEAHKRYGTPLSLLMLDVDDNDLYREKEKKGQPDIHNVSANLSNMLSEERGLK